MPQLTWTFWGAVLGGLGVALGAFGAHGLEGRLTPRDLAIFETAVRYQLYHALVLVACDGVAWLLRQQGGGALPWLRAAGFSFVLGTVLFSGSLYVLVLTGQRKLGMVTPLGGLALLAGWALLGVAAWRGR